MTNPRMKLAAVIFFIFAAAPVFASADLYFESGGGYAGNLYADSFNIGNYYMQNTASFTYFRPGTTGFRLQYDFSYYEYDVNNLISNFYHRAGVSVFDRRYTKRFKWSLSAFGAIKDYIDPEATFNNGRAWLDVETSYYLTPSLRADFDYRFTYSDYSDYDILRHIENSAELSLAKTFPTKTTLNSAISYSSRSFSDNPDIGWVSLQAGLSQSIDLKTGIGVKIMQRWSSDYTRPLSSFYIISGVTSYWDPWDGQQAELTVKRILPRAFLSNLYLRFWNRKFTYDSTMQSELYWLDGKTGRNDTGWSVNLNLRRQFNIKNRILKSVVLSLAAGYLSNDSDDPYYQFGDKFATASLRLNVI